MQTTKIRALAELKDQDLVSEEHALEVGLSLDEFERIKRLLARDVNKVELAVIGALWSEHCSYKSTKAHLSRLPSKGERVVVGPGENAGAVDIGDDLALVFKIESHNHPSFIEPFQGAATGVGGILRDIFTMGARPFACANLLRFGERSHKKVPSLLDGVVSGIAHYGNCFGVATVLSNVDFHKSYNGNNLVNAFAIGVVKKNQLFLGDARGVKNRVLYVGAKTGRDGIMGAVMASDVFGAESEHKRPTVQVGDPFKEKLLLEACMECFERNLVVGIQDMGAAGMTSSSFEMANRASTGLKINLDLIPLRDQKMTAYDIMLSESQERMLMVVEPKKAADIKKIFDKYQLDCVDIGVVSGDGLVKVSHRGQEVINLASTLIVENAPRYRRSYQSLVPRKDCGRLKDRIKFSMAQVFDAWQKDLGLKDLNFITEQFDHHIGLNTVVGPGEADAALLRIPHSKKACAISLVGHGRLCHYDPLEGARQSVFQAVLEVAAQGAVPIGISNCLNFGSPENELVMTDLKHVIDGMAHAASALEIPVISGNVSLYNETNGAAILPTLALTLVGLNDEPSVFSKFSNAQAGDHLILLGEMPDDFAGFEAILPPGLPLKNLRTWNENNIATMAKIMRDALSQNICRTIANIGRGGLIHALIKIMAKANIGATLDFGDEWLEHEISMGLVSEENPRALLCVREDKLSELAALCAQKVSLNKLGKLGGEQLLLRHVGQKKWSQSLSEIKKVFNSSLGEVLAK